MSCDHRTGVSYQSNVVVYYLKDREVFFADVQIMCSCGMPFMFQNLPLGMPDKGYAMSPNGLELRAIIMPADSGPSPVEVLIEGTQGQRRN